MGKSNTGYEANIIETSKELTARERLMMKDTSNAIKLDEATEEAIATNGEILITPVEYVVLDVHNDKAEDKKDYKKYIILDKDGTKYVTGSNPFFRSFMEIWDEMKPTGEEYQIVAYRLPSKNYNNKDFLTCSIN